MNCGSSAGTIEYPARLRISAPHIAATIPADGRTAVIGRSGIVWCVLAGDTRWVLGKVVGDREPRRLVDDKRVRVGTEAGVVVERSQRDAVERYGAGVGLCAARVFLEFHQHRRAAHFAKAAVRARRRLVERDKLLAGERA